MTTPVDALMGTAAQVAARDGVTSQAVTKRVRALVASGGLSVDRDARGRIVAFNVAQYDHLTGRPGLLLPAPPAANPSETYEEALRQKTWHEAERRRLELVDLRRRLIPAEEIAAVVEACRETIGRVVDRLPDAADVLAARLAADGAGGLRLALKQAAREMRRDIAAALAAAAAPTGDTDCS